jgi:hypothetical protein
MQVYVQTDKSGTHETYAVLGLQFDKTYCLKPGNFPAEAGLKLNTMGVPISDGVGTYEVRSYWSNVIDGTMLRIESANEQECAKSASLSKFYVPGEVGPPMTSVIPSDLANAALPHPPFTAADLWQKLIAMIRLHSGYIAPDEIEQAFGLKFTPIAISYKSVAMRDLHAPGGWKFSLHYGVTGPGYQSVQPGVVANGQGSSLTIEIPSFFFLGTLGESECLPMSLIETDLFHAGWTVAPPKVGQPKLGPFSHLEIKIFEITGKDAHIRVTAQEEGNHYCVMGIRVDGALQ